MNKESVQNLNIMALDDEKAPLKLLVNALKQILPDAEIHTYMNPIDALVFASEAKVDIAFLDIRMPGITGLQAAKKLKEFNPSTKIIFTTSYSEYALDAFGVHASGYLVKPVTAEDLKIELDNLIDVDQNEIQHSGIFASCFGNFDLLKDGVPVNFQRAKAKELLALLIDKSGSTLTRKEIATYLFEDSEYTRSVQSYISQIIKSLRADLEDAGIYDLLRLDRNSYSVDVASFECDAYDYMKGVPAALSAFGGEYMSQYAWSEYSIGRFYK